MTMEEPTTYRVSTPREDEICDKVIRLLAQIDLYRVNFANQWDEVAELIAPNLRNTFMRFNYNFPGQKKTERQVDASGMLALDRFTSIVDSLITPRNMTWHGLEADNDKVQKDRQVRLWFEHAGRLLFKARYAPTANFAGQNHANFASLGAFGNMGMFIDQLVDEQGNKARGLRYKALPIGETFIRENHQGLVDSYVRWFRLTARQALQKWGDFCPEALWQAAKQQSEALYDFYHAVIPNDNYDPLSLRSDKLKYASYYVSAAGRCLLSEGGYNTFPLAFSRYEQAPGEVYGRGPAMNVLPALKTLNAEKSVFLTSGHRAATGVFLTSDDGLVDGVSLRPGATNKGGVDDQGRPRVLRLPDGTIQVTQEMMQEERQLINDSFLVTLFQILVETPTMTATEVIERINEKGILLAPTIGRQQSEYLGPMIDRELDLMVEMKMLPPMPGLLREAKGEYHVVYTSPMARAQRAQEAAGFMRVLESINAIAQVTQDPSLYDRLDFDKAIPDIAYIQGVQESWLRGDKEIEAIRQQRAKAQAKQQQIQAAPAAAALMKARAIAGEKGAPIPGQ